MMAKPVAAMVVAAVEPKRGRKLTFAAPDGFDTEGKVEGETLEVVAELEIGKGGKLCLNKINGIDLQGYEEKEPPKPADFTDAVLPESNA